MIDCFVAFSHLLPGETFMITASGACVIKCSVQNYVNGSRVGEIERGRE